MRESHIPRERTRYPDLVRAPREQHHPWPKVLQLNRLLAQAESPYAHLPWDICPDSSHTSRETRQGRSACRGQSHQNSQRQQGPLTSDTTRDGNQHPFLQVNHPVYMCCRSRCYAPIKRVVPLLHSIITPLTSDIADASDNMRDGNQQPFSQVNHSLYMCCRSFRRYAPIKKGVPLFHSITTPIKMPSQQGRSTPIHSTGSSGHSLITASWGAQE